MNAVGDRAEDFKGVEINKEELAQTIKKHTKGISASALKKRGKKKKKITIMPKRDTVKRVAEESPEVEVELAAPIEKKRAKVLDLDDPVPHDEQASLLEEMRERYSAAVAHSERLELELAELKARAQPVAVDKTGIVQEAGHLVVKIEELAVRIPTLDRANDDEDDITPVPPPADLDAFGALAYLVDNFHDIATQFARVNLLPAIQEQVETYVADLQRDHEKQLEGKDAEYERQTEYLEERERQHISVSKMFKTYREIDTEDYLKKAAETDAALQMAKKALKEEARRKDIATRKAEVAKEEAREAKKVASELKKENEDLKSKNIELNKQCVSWQGKFARLNAGEGLAGVEQVQFGLPEESQKNKLEEQSQKITELEWNLLGEKDRHSKTKQELNDLRAKYTKMERETTPLVNKVEDYRKETKAAKKKLEEVTAELTAKYEESEKISMRARSAAREAREKQVQAESKLKEVEDEYARVSIESMSYKDLMQVADKERDEARSEMAKCIEGNKAWQANSVAQKAEIEKLQEYNKSWVEASNVWKEEKSKLFNAVKTCKAESAELQKKLEEALASQGQSQGTTTPDAPCGTSAEHEARVKELEALNAKLTAANEEYMQGIVTLETMVKEMSAKSLENSSVVSEGDVQFNAVLKQLALAYVSTLRNIIGALAKMGFGDNTQLQQVAQNTQLFIKALSACEKTGPTKEAMEMIHKFINEPLPSSADGQTSPFPQAETPLDICGAAFIKLAERWKISIDQARAEAQKYSQSIQEQHLMYAKELTAFKLAARSVEEGDISEALMAHVQAMEKIKDEKDGARALAEVQHMQAFVAFIKHHLEWDAEDEEDE